VFIHSTIANKAMAASGLEEKLTQEHLLKPNAYSVDIEK